MAKRTITLNRPTAKTWLRRGLIPSKLYKQVEQGKRVQIEYSGSLMQASTVRLYSHTVDGVRTAYGKPVTPDVQRGAKATRAPAYSTPGEQRLGEKTVSQRTSRDTSPTPRIARTGTIAGQQPTTQTMTISEPPPRPEQIAELGRAEVQAGLPPTTGITARDIFGVAQRKGLSAEEVSGQGPVFRGRQISDTETEYLAVGGRGTGFATPTERISAAQRELERDLGMYGRQEDIQSLKSLWKPPKMPLKEVAKKVGTSFVIPTKKRAEESWEALTRFESERISPSISKTLGIKETEFKREVAGREYETALARDVAGKFTVPGGKQKAYRDVLDISLGLGTALSKPVTVVVPEIALGIATGGAFRGAGVLLERAPTKVLQKLASPTGQFIRKSARGLSYGSFAAIEAVSIGKSGDPFRRIGELPIRLAGFGAGEALSAKAFTPKVRRKVGTPYAELGRQEQLLMTKAPKGKKWFDPFIELQRKASAAERKGILQVESKALTPKRLPEAIPKEARPGVVKAIKEQDLLVFGSESVSLKYGKRFERLRSLYAGEPKPVGDIDTAIGQVKLGGAGEALARTVRPAARGLEVKQQSIGLRGGEKFFDIKPMERLEAFEFIGPIKQTRERMPVRTTSISEEFARKIAGGIEWRKGGKDIPDILAISRLLTEDAKTARLLGVSPKLRKTILKRTSTGAGNLKELSSLLGKPGKSVRKGRGISVLPDRSVLKAPRVPSRLPISKLPRSSRLPGVSKFSSSKLSKSIFGKQSSKVPSILKPSRLPKSILKPSRISSVLPSKISRSRLPSELSRSVFGTSKLPKTTPSRIPTSRIPSSRIPNILIGPPPTKILPPDLDIRPLKDEQKTQERELKRPFKYLPTVEAADIQLYGKVPKRLTGLEIRPIIKM